jgi:hypothetical protein
MSHVVLCAVIVLRPNTNLAVFQFTVLFGLLLGVAATLPDLVSQLVYFLPILLPAILKPDLRA